MTAADPEETALLRRAERGRPPGRRRTIVFVIAVVLTAAAAGGAWWWVTAARARAERDAAQVLIDRFVRGYAQQDLSGVPSSSPDMAAQFTAATEGLGDATVAVETGPVVIDEDGATSDLVVDWTLPGDHAWGYTSRVDLARVAGEQAGWQIAWTPAVIEPELRSGDRLRTRRSLPERGDIVDATGDPIVTPRPVVDVSVQPGRVDDLDALTATLATTLDIDGDDLARRVDKAADNALVPVITLRERDYADVEDTIYPLPGTVFRRSTRPLAPTRTFARAFLGTVGDVTAEQLEAEPGSYQRGDVVGRSGVQQLFDQRLRGSAGIAVEVVNDADADDDDVRVLHAVEPTGGRDVAVTLRRRVQRAADAALADVARPSALVAIDVPSGDIAAIANGPGAAFDIATRGQYPPGSTFKVVTATRLFDDGLTADATVACPDAVTVDGRVFGNAENARLGDVPFATAFAQSCNTAFIGQSRQLDEGALAATAEQRFGIGARSDLGIGAYRGQVPTEDSDVEIAAAAIGQGRVLVSPLIAADIAATVARGRWREPRILVDPEADAQAVAERLPAAGVLRRLMRAVVTDGSGTALREVPGAPVRGKTGTAEYGDDDPPRTHAWFIGYQDDLAFAVLVAETADSYGGRIAAPIAARFLTALR